MEVADSVRALATSSVNATGVDESHDAHQRLLALFFPFFALMAGAAIRTVGHKLKLPYTVILLIFGFLIGLIIRTTEAEDSFATSAKIIANLDPHMMLYIFLPPLIFESAFSIE